jgi:hypothetical protein
MKTQLFKAFSTLQLCKIKLEKKEAAQISLYKSWGGIEQIKR